MIWRAGLERTRSNAGGAPAPTSAGPPSAGGAGAQWVVVRVHDAGPGIAPELLPTLFERFRVGPSSAGLGLGLYLARNIAAAHGGSLTIEEPATAGACFRLALPVRPEDDAGPKTG